MIRRETFPQPSAFNSLASLQHALPQGMVPLGFMPMPSFQNPMIQAPPNQFQEILDANWQSQQTIAAQEKRIKHLEKKLARVVDFISRNPKFLKEMSRLDKDEPTSPPPEPIQILVEEAPSLQQIQDDCREYNLEVSKGGDPEQFLKPVPGNNGQIPPGFPECAEALKQMKGRDLRVLFNAYGIEDSFKSIRKAGCQDGDAEIYDVMNRSRLAEEIGAIEFKYFFEEGLNA